MPRAGPFPQAARLRPARGPGLGAQANGSAAGPGRGPPRNVDTAREPMGVRQGRGREAGRASRAKGAWPAGSLPAARRGRRPIEGRGRRPGQPGPARPGGPCPERPPSPLQPRHPAGRLAMEAERPPLPVPGCGRPPPRAAGRDPAAAPVSVPAPPQVPGAGGRGADQTPSLQRWRRGCTNFGPRGAGRPWRSARVRGPGSAGPGGPGALPAAPGRGRGRGRGCAVPTGRSRFGGRVRSGSAVGAGNPRAAACAEPAPSAGPCRGRRLCGLGVRAASGAGAASRQPRGPGDVGGGGGGAPEAVGAHPGARAEVSQGLSRQAEVGVRTRALVCAGVVGGARARAFSSPTPRSVEGSWWRAGQGPDLGFPSPSPALQRWRSGAEITSVSCPVRPPSSGGQSAELGGGPCQSLCRRGCPLT